MTPRIVILIPSYNHGDTLCKLAEELLARSEHGLVIVDDGSTDGTAEKLAEIMNRTRPFTVLKHLSNKGKGAALKTGFIRIRDFFPDAVSTVTADADGQHSPDCILSVCSAVEKEPSQLILGTRTFSSGVPFRNMFGNRFARSMLGLLGGVRVSDAQTGLRGIPSAMIPHLLKLKSPGYAFELEMLLLAGRMKMTISEHPIRTIYGGAGELSHFSPVTDSVKIAFSLLRYSIAGTFQPKPRMRRSTDWELYYESPCFTAYYARSIIRRRLASVLKKHAPPSPSVIELGGGASSFYRRLVKVLSPSSYTVYDSSPAGIRLFSDIARSDRTAKSVLQDIFTLDTSKEEKADIVFSVGLVEHFSEDDTARLAAKHFELVKPDGAAVMFYPTPTLLYRCVRYSAEVTGCWAFPDERPLSVEELSASAPHGFELADCGTVYANFLTQQYAVFKKKKE